MAMKNQINSEVLHVASRTLKTGIGVCQRKKRIEIVEKGSDSCFSDLICSFKNLSDMMMSGFKVGRIEIAPKIFTSESR